VFICLYYAIKRSPELMHAGFLWMTLGKPDPYYVLLLIYVVSQLVSTELMLSPQTDRQQKMLMRLMPLFFVFILRRFPSGLFIYWITTNIWTVGQQLIIRRTMPPVVAPVSGGGNEPAGRPVRGGKTGKGAKPKKQGRFMSALMAAQEQREQQLTTRRKAAGKPGAKPGAKKASSAGKPMKKPSGGGPSGGRPAKKASGRRNGRDKP
jgi:YidC/Oxa1 family membrane protein insertase